MPSRCRCGPRWRAFDRHALPQVRPQLLAAGACGMPSTRKAVSGGQTCAHLKAGPDRKVTSTYLDHKLQPNTLPTAANRLSATTPVPTHLQ
jgi:hypothetical protein